jgi:prevent-host-death family protein
VPDWFGGSLAALRPLIEFLRRVANGERITVTDRGRPIAVIPPAEHEQGLEDIVAMVREGRAAWGGVKPRGADRPIRIRGKPISDTVLEDRR